MDTWTPPSSDTAVQDWTPPTGDSPVQGFTPPSGDTPVSPEDIQRQVQAGYIRSGQLSAEGEQAQRASAFAEAHPYANAGLNLARESGIPSAMAGAEKVITGGNYGYWQDVNQQIQGGNIDADTGLAKAGGLVGQASGFVTNLNPGLSGVESAAGAYGEGESALQSIGHGAVNFIAGHLLQKGINSTMADTIASKLAPYARPLIAKLGARAAAGALTQAANAGANNLISGKPFTEGLTDTALIGALGEAGIGALHDMAPKMGADKFLGSSPSGQVLPQENSTAGKTATPTPPVGLDPKQLRQQVAPLPGEAPEVTAYRQQISDLKNRLHTDTVTGGGNGERFNDEAPMILDAADRMKRPVAVITTDLNNFKVTQDNFGGHAVGDDILTMAHESLRRAARVAPQVGRPDDYVYGPNPDAVDRAHGDEFHAILNNVKDEAGAQAMIDRANKDLDAKIAAKYPDIPPNLRPQIAHGAEIRNPGDSRPISDLLQAADQKVPARKSAMKATGGVPEGRFELQKYIDDYKANRGRAAGDAAIGRVTEKAPPGAVTPDTFPPEVADTTGKLLSDTASPRMIRKNILGGQSIGQTLGGYWQHLTRSIAYGMGGEVGRGRNEKAVMSAIQKADSTTNQIALRNEAARKPYIDRLRQMKNEPGGQTKINRLVDELDSGQPVSDPFFKGYQKLQEHGKDLIEGLKSIGVNTSSMIPDRVLRNFSDTDDAGKAPWEADYKGPSKTGRGGSLQGNWQNYGRSIETYEDSIKVNQAAGRVEKYPDPLTGHMAKQADVWQKINAAKMAQEELAAGRIRELNPGDKIQVGEKVLDDKLFEPFPRKLAASARIASKLNDIDVPFKERLAIFRQGLKDGTINPAGGADPDAQEIYNGGIHKVTGFMKEGEVREKYKQGSPHATGEYLRGPRGTTGYEQAENPASGEYSPSWKGNLPEGHMLIDDAMAQADRRRYVADGPNADILNNHLQPAPVDPDNAVFKVWNWVNKVTNIARIGLSGMHYLILRGAANAERMGAALNSALHGQVGESIKAIGQTIPVHDMFQLIKAGQAFKEAIADPLAHPDLQPAVEQARQAGGIIEKPSLSAQERKPYIRPNIVGGVMDASQHLLFDKYADPIRRGAMSLAIQDEIKLAQKAGKSLSDPDVQARIKNSVNSTFDIFDTIRKDRNFQDNASRLVLKGVFAFPNWSLSKVRLAARSVGDLPETFKSMNLTPAQKYMAGSLLRVAMTGGAITWAATGKPPSSARDFFYPQIWGGKRIVLPGPLLPLISLAIGAQSGGQWLENRMNPGIQVGQELVQNKDYRNVHTRDTMEEAAKTVGTNLTPSFMGDANKSESPLEHIGDFFGIRKASERLNWTPAEREAHDIFAEKAEAGGRTQEEETKKQTFNDLLQGLKDKVSGTRQKITEAAQKGILTDEDRKNLFKYAHEGTGLMGLLQAKEISPQDIVRVWGKMNEAEKTQTRGFVRSKIAKARNLRPQEKQTMFKIVGQ